jgi:hypothetical protein
MNRSFARIEAPGKARVVADELPLPSPRSRRRQENLKSNMGWHATDEPGFGPGNRRRERLARPCVGGYEGRPA